MSVVNYKQYGLHYLRKILVPFYHRWSTLVPLVLYLTLLTLTWTISPPLRSPSNRVKKPSVFMRKMAEERGERIAESGRKFEIEDNLPTLIRNAGDSRFSEAGPPQFVLEEIFHKADSDQDDRLSVAELSNWINVKTQEHIHKAIVDNYGIFTAIDIKPRNGMISWDEYHTYFLHQSGLDNEYVEKHSEKHSELNRSTKEAIMRDRAAWSEAARTDPDHLTLDEFLAFKHPESSHVTILSLVDELFDKFDRDGDEVLTENEFSTLQTDGDGDKEGETFTQGEAERRREFRDIIDKNKDGKANRQELLMYIDPKNPRHAKEEAETLMILADSDHDGELSLIEVLNKVDLFLGSKMVDTARSFHDEF